MKNSFYKCSTARAILTILIGQLVFCNGVYAQGDALRSFRLLNYMTGWSLDTTVGYHPCVYLYLMNISNRDLSSEAIKFQGKFTDLQSAEITRGKLEIRRPLKPNQTTAVCICANGRYQLPIQTHLWPLLEAKIMLRVGETEGDSTETVVTTTIDSEVRSAEQAFSALNQISSFERKPAAAPSVHPRRIESKSQSGHAAAAVPGKNNGTAAPAVAARPALPTLFASKGLPGLGDDFYNFEQFFGRPVRLDTDRPAWTWSEYKHAATGARVFVGSHGRSGKADLILFLGQGNITESALLAGAPAFAGMAKAAGLEKPVKSVRYLPTGRIEIALQKGQAYNVACVSPDNPAAAGRVLILAKAAKDLDLVMFEPLRASKLLAGLPFARGAGEVPASLPDTSSPSLSTSSAPAPAPAAAD